MGGEYEVEGVAEKERGCVAYACAADGDGQEAWRAAEAGIMSLLVAVSATRRVRP